MIENTTTENIKVYKWICSECGKVIKSFHIREFEYNCKAHKLKHTLKGKELNTARKYSEEVLKELKKDRLSSLINNKKEGV